MPKYSIEDILQHEWSKQTVERFVAHCYDRQSLMSALISYAREFMTHRILMRVKRGAFRAFLLQGWPEHVDEAEKTPRLRKLELPAATSSRVKRALSEGYEVAGLPEEFGLGRVLQFLGEEIDEELLCQPITVGPQTEWVLIGKPIRIDQNSPTFSNDAVRLNFWELAEVCDKVGAQYQKIRRLSKTNKLPPQNRRVPPLDDPASQSQPDLNANLEPVEVNKRTQQRIQADADGFSADRFLEGKDAFGTLTGGAKPPPEQLGAEVSEAEQDEGVGVTTGIFKGLVDPSMMAQFNYGHSSEEDDEDAPALADIEHTAGIQLDESVLSAAKKTYNETLAREERKKRLEREKKRQSQAGGAQAQPANRPITAEERTKVKKAIALMDSSEREKAFRAAKYISGFGERSVKTLGRLFPGRLCIDRYQYQVRDMPPVEQHSPVLYALAHLGEPAIKVAKHYLDDSSNDLRFYATYLYTRIPAEQDLDKLLPRLFDRDRQTRNMARRIVASLRRADHFEHLILQPLRNELADGNDEFRQLVAIEVLGACRDISSIDALIRILKFSNGRTQTLAHNALRAITLQDLSAAAVSWEQWWANQRPDYADQWLVGALDSDSDEIRHLAWAEVHRLEGIDIDYHPNYPRGRRRDAQNELAVWLGVKQQF